MGRITASRKQLAPDPKCGSLLASKFVNCLMWDGKKSIAQNVFYDALDIIAKKIHDVEPIEVFTQAVENVKPNIEVRSKRVGGASYQVPMQVNRNRQQSLAIRWILMAIREKKGKPTAKASAKKQTLNPPGETQRKTRGAPATDLDPKRRLGNFEAAGEHSRVGGRTSGIVGQTTKTFRTNNKKKGK